MANFSTYKPTLSGTDYVTRVNGAMDELDARFNTAATFAGTLAVTGIATFTGNVVAATIRRGTSDGADNSELILAGGGSASGTRGAYLQLHGNESAGGGDAILTAGSGSDITLSAVKVVISGGSVCVGTTSATDYTSSEALRSYNNQVGDTGALFMQGNAAGFCAVAWNKATSGDNVFTLFATESGGTTRGSIDYNRGGGAVRYNTTSDQRLKNDFTPLVNVGGVIDALTPGSYSWDESYEPGAVGVGFRAQEVHAVIPEAGAATVGDDDPEKRVGDLGFVAWAMDPAKLVPYLWAELKSIRVRVAALENP